MTRLEGAVPTPRARAVPRRHVREAQRARVLAAMVDLTYRRSAQSATVTEIVSSAGVSRRTFYELFEDRDACLLAAIEHALARARHRVLPAYQAESVWVDRVRSGLRELLAFFDEESKLAWLCTVQWVDAGPAALALRWETLEVLAQVVDGGREVARHQPPRLTAEGVLGGVTGVIHTRMLKPDAGSMLELLGPLMSIITLPYLGNAGARRELERGERDARKTLEAGRATNPLSELSFRLTYRTLAVLRAVALEPGLSNKQIGERAGVADPGQISRLLGRLSDRNLLENIGGGQARGTTNAWRLTPGGVEVERALHRDSVLRVR